MHIRRVRNEEDAMRWFVEALWVPYLRDLETAVEAYVVADDLVARAIQHAREDGAVELALDVAVDNERALAYYEKLGFDVGKYRMRAPLEEVQLEKRS
jgi:GNAT superfamily N-acetyltransferase